MNITTRKKLTRQKLRPIQIGKKKHWKAIKGNYTKAPYFKNELEKFYQKEWKYLSDLTIEMNKEICRLMGIKTKFFLSSELGVSGKSNEKLVNICKAVGADTYLSGKGAVDVQANAYGKPYLDKVLFTKQNIDVEVQDFHYPKYKQLWEEFVPNLSILDVMFNLGPKLKNT